jgi:SUKH-3 immunity protein
VTGRFSREVEESLQAAGWFPGRRLDPEILAAMRSAITRHSSRYGGRLAVFPAAEEVLAEFGGLVLGGDRPGVEVNPRPFALDPTLVAHQVETLLDVGRALGVRVCPLGVEGLDEAVLAITEPGAVLAVDPTGEWLLGNAIDEALDLLVSGHAARPVGPGDRPPPRLRLAGTADLAGAAFFLPRTPANLYQTWLPDTLTRLGVVAVASPTEPGGFEVDWAGRRCAAYPLDLADYTTLVLAFEPPNDLPAASASLRDTFRNACAALTPDLQVAFVRVTPVPDVLRLVADRELDVRAANGHALLGQGFDLLYLTGRFDYGIEHTTVSSVGSEYPVTGGRLIAAGAAGGDQP